MGARTGLPSTISTIAGVVLAIIVGTCWLIARIDRRVDFFEAGDHVIERDVERHGGVNVADFLLHFGFVLGIKSGEAGAEDLDIADVDGSRADVGNRVGAPGNYAEDLLASGRRDRDRGVGDERAVFFPGLELRLVDDDVVAVSDRLLWATRGRRGRKPRVQTMWCLRLRR